MSFKNLKPGDKVAFSAGGYGLDRNGNRIRRRVTAKVLPMLVFETHVVVDRGMCGSVVDESNFIGVVA